MKDSDSRAARWKALADAGLVRGEAPLIDASSQPWMISALIGASAWLAALFLLFFLGMALEDLLRKPAGAIGVGVTVCAAAALAFRFARERMFVAQLAFAFSLAGQALVLVGIVMESGRDEAWRWWLFAAFEAVLIAAAPHGGHRVLATFAAAMGVLVGLWVLSFSALFLPLALAAFVFVQSRTLAAAPNPALWHALAIGLALAMIGGFVHAALPELWRPSATAGAWGTLVLRWVSVALLAAVAACAGWLAVRDAVGREAGHTGALAAAALAALAVASFPVPAAAAAIVMLVSAFAAGQRVIAAIAILGLLGSLAHYYYRLDTTLVAKAGAWLAIGILLLIARAVALRLVRVPGEIGDA